MKSNYALFDPKIERPLHELTRREATAAYEWFISQRDERIDILTQHARELGYELNGNIESVLENLHQLFIAEVHGEGKAETPTAYVFSLCNDIALFISDRLILKAPQLHWGMFTAGKKDISYQRPVLQGFNVANKKFNVDIDYVLCTYAYRLCRGGAVEEKDYFWRIFNSALSKA
ncbi:MAG: hypothetical protein ACPIA2_17280 [Mariniblastus sp.]